jgi:hypothetical protein
MEDLILKNTETSTSFLDNVNSKKIERPSTKNPPVYKYFSKPLLRDRLTLSLTILDKKYEDKELL